MSQNRENFSLSTRRIIAQRAGYLCSYPGCTCGTVGPAEDSNKSINVGEACHICAASPQGPRYDPKMTKEERVSALNGIWMCRTHAAEIDRDINRYTVDLLKKWKEEAEKRADEKRRINIGSNEIYIQNVNGRFTHFFAEHKYIYRNFVFLFYILLIGSIPLFRRLRIVEYLDLMDRVILFFLITAIILGLLWKIETDPRIASKCNGTILEIDIVNDSPKQLMAKIVGVFGDKVLLSNTSKQGFNDFYQFERMSFGGWEENRINYLKIDFQHILEYYDPSVLFLHNLSTRNTAIRLLSRQGFILQDKDYNSQYTYLKKGNLNVFLLMKANGFLRRVVILNCTDKETRIQYERYVKYDL